MEPKKTISVVIADDHTLFRKGIAEILSAYEDIELLFGAANGQELIDWIQQSPQKPDVCILDINMPVMNGYDAASKIRKLYPGMRILALSMYDDEFNVLKMYRSGATGYVLKDIEPEKLREAILMMHGSGYYHSEVLTDGVKRLLQKEPGETELSEKETTLLMHICSEHTYREIAEIMGVSSRTIDGYRDALFEKLNIKSRTGLVIYALKTGIAKID